MVYISFGLVLLFMKSTAVTSDTPSLTICYEGQVTANSVQLNMNTSAIVGTNGSCQCNILFHMHSAFHISSQHLTSPNCGTKIGLSDVSFKHTCAHSSIPPISYTKNVESNVQLFIRAKENGKGDLPMFGTIQLNTDDNTNFTLQCYETKVKRMTTTSTVTTSISLTTSTLKTTLKTSTNGGSLSIPTITITTASTIVSRESTTKEDAHMITTQSKGNLTGVTKTEFPVALTAGCAIGGVALVGPVVVAVLICRRKRKKPKKEIIKQYETPSLPRRDTRPFDDEYLSMENELYCSSADLATGSAIKPNDKPNGIGGGGKKKNVLSPNGNNYALVENLTNKTSPPKPNINHRASPSGDVYTVVDKLT